MPIDAAILFLILALPLHFLVLRHFDQLRDPAYLRRQGIVVRVDSVLDAQSPPIGEYQGRPIWGTVTFQGMDYRFDRVQQRKALGAGELFLEPGLVYVVT